MPAHCKLQIFKPQSLPSSDAKFPGSCRSCAGFQLGHRILGLSDESVQGTTSMYKIEMYCEPNKASTAASRLEGR